MLDSVDGQKNGSLSIPKPLSNRNKSGHELPTNNNKIIAETPSDCKGTFSAGKYPKLISWGSSGLS